MKQAIGVVVCVIDPPFQNSFGLISIHFMNHHTSGCSVFGGYQSGDFYWSRWAGSHCEQSLKQQGSVPCEVNHDIRPQDPEVLIRMFVLT